LASSSFCRWPERKEKVTVSRVPVSDCKYCQTLGANLYTAPALLAVNAGAEEAEDHPYILNYDVRITLALIVGHDVASSSRTARPEWPALMTVGRVEG